MLDPLEFLLNSPPGVIERAEFAGGESVEVEKRGHEHARLVTEHLANEANFARRGGNFVIERILFAGSGERDDLLDQTGSTEGLNGVEIQAVRAHAEMASSLQQGSEEPAGRVTAVEHQGVLVAEFVQVFEEHLALADVGRIQLGRQRHLDPRQIECEANGVDHMADE